MRLPQECRDLLNHLYVPVTSNPEERSCERTAQTVQWALHCPPVWRMSLPNTNLDGAWRYTWARIMSQPLTHILKDGTLQLHCVYPRSAGVL